MCPSSLFFLTNVNLFANIFCFCFVKLVSLFLKKNQKKEEKKHLFNQQLLHPILFKFIKFHFICIFLQPTIFPVDVACGKPFPYSGIKLNIYADDNVIST